MQLEYVFFKTFVKPTDVEKHTWSIYEMKWFIMSGIGHYKQINAVIDVNWSNCGTWGACLARNVQYRAKSGSLFPGQRSTLKLIENAKNGEIYVRYKYKLTWLYPTTEPVLCPVGAPNRDWEYTGEVANDWNHMISWLHHCGCQSLFVCLFTCTELLQTKQYGNRVNLSNCFVYS